MRKTRQNKKTSSKRRQTKKYMKYGGEDIAVENEIISEENAGYCIFKTKNISTEQNTSKKKEEKVGVIHFTDSGSINALRQTFTGIANIFGNKGFDNIIYDKIRNEALRKLDELLERKQHKLYNMRMEFSNNNDTILIHIYGTLYKQKGAPDADENSMSEDLSQAVVGEQTQQTEEQQPQQTEEEQPQQTEEEQPPQTEEQQPQQTEEEQPQQTEEQQPQQTEEEQPQQTEATEGELQENALEKEEIKK